MAQDILRHGYAWIPQYPINPHDLDDHEAAGFITFDTIGEAVVIGNALYLRNTGKYEKADADWGSRMPVVGIALAAGAANDIIKILLLGFFRDDSYSWNIGGEATILYASTNPGVLSQSKPGGSGDKIQIVAFPIASNIIYFNPSYKIETV